MMSCRLVTFGRWGIKRAFRRAFFLQRSEFACGGRCVGVVRLRYLLNGHSDFSFDRMLGARKRQHDLQETIIRGLKNLYSTFLMKTEDRMGRRKAGRRRLWGAGRRQPTHLLRESWVM